MAKFKVFGKTTTRKECVELLGLTKSVFNDRLAHGIINKYINTPNQAVIFYELCKRYSTVSLKDAQKITNFIYMIHSMPEHIDVFDQHLTKENMPKLTNELIANLAKELGVSDYCVIYTIVRGYILDSSIKSVAKSTQTLINFIFPTICK